MSIDKPIPEDFPAGWQAVETGIILTGDILITHGDHKQWATAAVGAAVEHFLGRGSFYRACYRRMPCPRQQDTDVTQSTSALVTEGTSAVATADFRHVDRVPDLTPAALPTSAAQRKGIPVYSGFLAYFPKAIAAVAKLSKIGNDQHNPGKPLHWDRSKSGDELDALARHLLDIAETDTDDTPHEVKVAWRAMANLQKSIETNPQRFEKFFAK